MGFTAETPTGAMKLYAGSDDGSHFIVDDFLTPDLLDRFTEAIEALEPRLSEGMVSREGQRAPSRLKRNETVRLEKDHRICRAFLGRLWCPPMEHFLRGQRQRIYRKMFHPKNEKMQLSAYGDGAYYAPHRDGRTVTVNLFLSREPRKFEGGDLVLHLPDGDAVVPFRNNRLILFDGMIPHEVRASKEEGRAQRQ